MHQLTHCSATQPLTMDSRSIYGCFRMRALFKKNNAAKSMESLYKPSVTTVDVLDVKKFDAVAVEARNGNLISTHSTSLPDINAAPSDETEMLDEDNPESPVQLRRKYMPEEIIGSTDEEDLDSGYTTATPDVLELVKNLDRRALKLNEIILENGNYASGCCMLLEVMQFQFR